MKCKYCGGEVSLEEKFCPHCGKPNEFATEHIKDMEHYKDEFDKTKKEVVANARKTSDLAVRIVIIAVLSAVIIVSLIASHSSYYIANVIKGKMAEANSKQNISQMEEYLDNGQYLEFEEFVDTHQIRMYDNDYSKYYRISVLTRSYEQIFLYVSNIKTDTKLSISSTDQADNAENLASAVADYYKYRNEASDKDDVFYSDIFEEHAENMDKDINGMLITYIGMTQDEVENLGNASTGTIMTEIEGHLEITE